MADNFDKELWQKAAHGDKEAESRIFQHLVERFTVIAGLSMCKEDAKDLAHDTCLSVLKGYKSLGNPFEYSAWAQKIFRNNIADYFQRRAVEKKLFSQGEFSEELEIAADGADQRELMLTLQECLKKLAAAYPPYARALHLRQSGYDTESICRKMKVTRNNLYVLLNRGRGFLRNCIFGERDK